MAGGCEGICCDECGAEIVWMPIVIDGRPYCCHDCGVGMECDDAPPLWLESVEEGTESSSGIDYYAFD
jgi:hypothetical protein